MSNSGLWLLLITLALFLGFYIGYQARFSQRAKEFYLPRNYLLGLQYWCNDQTDKALDIFIRMLEIDQHTIETHLALGSLFRRRGEFQRAIVIHQNLVNNKELDREQRLFALSELGHDYLSAGILDHAEAAFQQVLKIDPTAVHSLQALLDIYQRLHHWRAAITTAQALELNLGQPMHARIAHYYCAIAENHYHGLRYDQALDNARQALAINQSSARALLLIGSIEYQRSAYKIALKTFDQAIQRQPMLLIQILSMLLTAYQALDEQDNVVRVLHDYAKTYGYYPVIQQWIILLRARQGDQYAYEMLSDVLMRHPSYAGLGLLLELQVPAINKERDFFQQVLQRLSVNHIFYRCGHCGFSAKTFYWQCPSCKQWETFSYRQNSSYD